jgi:hypothetical protein
MWETERLWSVAGGQPVKTLATDEVAELDYVVLSTTWYYQKSV